LTSSAPLSLGTCSVARRVGTEITVWDLFAAEFGQLFFKSFLDGETAGVALARARRILLAKNNPLGLIEPLHASADLRLV
jgi:hypothetical protein